MDIHKVEHWDVLAATCIDGRFIKKTIDWLTEKTGGVFDFRTGVGSSKAILLSDKDRDTFFETIKTSVKLHHTKEVWLIDHIDCGAYGGSERFDCSEGEMDFHVGKLKESAKVVSEKFPELKVRTFYVTWDGVEEIS